MGQLRLLVGVLVLGSAAAAQAQPRNPHRLQQRRSGELQRRLSMARHQLRTAQGPELWLKGRVNRELAARLQVKLWRSRARQLRMDLRGLPATAPRRAGLLRQARRLEHKSARLDRTRAGYAERTAAWRANLIGGPTRAPSRTALARAAIAANRERLQALVGVEVSTPGQVRAFLETVPGTGRREMRHAFRSGWESKIVRQGFVNGRPRGYILSRRTDPETGDTVTLYEGTNISWARRQHGKNKAVAVLNNRHHRDRDGRVLRPIGTLTSLTHEVNRGGERTNARITTIRGNSLHRTTVRSRAGHEQYRAANINGAMDEERVRFGSDGWSAVTKHYDPQTGLLVRKESSTGRVSERQVDPRAAERLWRRVKRADRDPRAVVTHHKDGTWSYTRQATSPGAVGVVSARGKNGDLGLVESRYVSPLGTHYGTLREVIKARAATPSASPPIKVRRYPLARRDNNPYPAPEPAPKITMQDRQRQDQALDLASRVRGGRIEAVIDPASQDPHNAFADPTDNVVFRRTGPFGSRLQQVRNPDRAILGAGVATSSLAEQVGVLLHEGKHERQQGARHQLSALQSQTIMMDAVGDGLAEVPYLKYANVRRAMERGADTEAGRGLAKARKLTGDATLSPKAYLGRLKPRGVPFTRTWLPQSFYDRDRSRTTWRAYGKELRRPVKPAAPAHLKNKKK